MNSKSRKPIIEFRLRRYFSSSSVCSEIYDENTRYYIRRSWQFFHLQFVCTSDLCFISNTGSISNVRTRKYESRCRIVWLQNLSNKNVCNDVPVMFYTCDYAVLPGTRSYKEYDYYSNCLRRIECIYIDKHIDIFFVSLTLIISSYARRVKYSRDGTLMHFMQYVYDILPVAGVRLTRSFTKIQSIILLITCIYI